MRLLFVHADHLEFEVTAETGAGVAGADGVPASGRMEDCVTAFVSVERADETDLDAVVESAAAEVRDVADRLNTRKVALYPSTHLSDDLADSDSAETALRDLDAALEADDHEVLRVPFGRYTAFEVASKGHPLAELSRRVAPDRGEDEADADRAASEWRLAFPDGEVRDAVAAADADRVSDGTRALVAAEVEGETASEDGPASVELLREKGLAGEGLASDSERGDADADGLRWYPRGKLVRDALTAHVEDLAVEYGAVPVESGDRRSGVESDDRQSPSRSGACLGPASAVGDVRLSESDLPLRLYEASGTPEIHTAVTDLERAKEELRAQAALALRVGEDLGLDYRPVIRLSREFYDEAWVRSLAAAFDRPALVELLPERRRDWSVEVEFVAVGQRAGPGPNPSVRLDAESAERFDVECGTDDTAETDDADRADEDTSHALVLRCSPSGGIEGAVAAVLGAAADREVPRLPTWLSPTQVRFVPVGDDHAAYCDRLAADLESAGVRADVDDRDGTVGERIARAESDWVPYYAVVGDRETEGGSDDHDGDGLEVTVRGERARETTVEELREAVLAEVGDRPRKRRYLPRRVGRRPQFTEG